MITVKDFINSCIYLKLNYRHLKNLGGDNRHFRHFIAKTFY